MQFSKKLLSGILLACFLMAGAASAQFVTVLSGDGQVAVQNNVAQAPMVVVVKNANGQPVPGTTVTWTLNGQGSLIQGNSSVTDANGQATNQFLGATLFGVSYAQATVTANVSGSTATFTETTAGLDPSSGSSVVQASVSSVPSPLSGPSGSTGSATPIRVQVYASGISGFQPIPNVLVRLIPKDPNGPQIACSGNTGYTDSTGFANCLPLFSGPNATGQFTIDVGGSYRVFDSGYTFSVTQGQFANFVIISGNNQSGAPGATLPLPAVAQARDASGSPLANVPVTWQSVTPGALSVSNASTASDAGGNVTANVTLGNTPGAVQLRLSNAAGTVQALFTFTVNLQLTGISKLAGDGQTGVVGTSFAQPLVVQVSTSQGPAAGVQVQFTSSGVPVQLPNSGIATTDSQGRATIAVQAGTSAGSATVTASVSGFTTTFSLTVRLPGPSVTSSSFFNAAGGQAGGVSPTSVLAIYAAGLAPGLQGCVSANQILGPLPLLLSNDTVLFTSGSYQSYGPMYAVCNLGTGQEYLVTQVPADLPLGAASITVRVGSGSTTVDNVPVSPFSPGIFETVMSDGKKRAVLQHAADGSYVTLENRATAGETLRAFVTGLGRPVSASGIRIGTNQGGILGDDAKPQTLVNVGIADQGVPVNSVVYAPDLVGVYIVTFQVPASAPSGADINFAIAATLNDSPIFGNPSKIPIR